MRIPTIRGIIDRRILANFRVDPDAIRRVLPPPFRPKLVRGRAIAGICLIRLKNIRPAFLPPLPALGRGRGRGFPWGIGSENAAHRIAVEWEENGQTREGVFVPRRDTSSRLNALAGGRLFPGVQHHAAFTVVETGDYLSVAIVSDDGDTRVRVAGHVADALPATSIFTTMAEASQFFEAGAIGYSATPIEGRYDGMELRCRNWHVEPLAVDTIESSFFQDKSRFPAGSAEFDCALVMRGIDHEWHGREDLCCAATTAR
ncbi:MAG: DUF2071 domain-containing protein [Pirellulales bacterium]